VSAPALSLSLERQDYHILTGLQDVIDCIEWAEFSCQFPRQHRAEDEAIAREAGRALAHRGFQILRASEPSFPADLCHEDGIRYPFTVRVF